MATTKQKFQRQVSNPTNQKVIEFLDDLQMLAKHAFGVAAQAIIEQFIYAKMPPHLKKSINQAHLQNGKYEQNVSHLKRELKLNGLEAPDELQRNTVTQQATQQNPGKPKRTCHHCKTTETSAVNSNVRKNKAKTIQLVPGITIVTVVKQTPTPTIKFLTLPIQTIQIFKKQETETCLPTL